MARTQPAFHQHRWRFFRAEAHGLAIRCSPQQVAPHERPLCHARPKTFVELRTACDPMSVYILSGRRVLVPDLARCLACLHQRRREREGASALLDLHRLGTNASPITHLSSSLIRLRLEPETLF